MVFRKIANIIFFCILALLLLWQLPWCYYFLTSKKADTVPFSLYSGQLGDFIQISSEDKVQVRRGFDGQEFTVEEADSLLPFMYMAQLVSKGRMPDTIQGVPVTPQLIKQHNINFTHRLYDTNRPQTRLWCLLESMPKRVDLELPDDAFRFTDDGIEFVEMNTNQVKAEKSQLFTDALQKKGFQFPALCVDGNATTRKEYDEGYLLIDQAHQLFHLKMTAGRPYVKAIQAPASQAHDLTTSQPFQAQYVFTTEFRDHSVRGFVTDQNHLLYVITPAYDVVPVGEPEQVEFDPTQNNIILMGNLLDWTIRISTPEAEQFYAVSADDYHLLRHRTVSNPDPYVFGLHFTEGADKWVYPRF